MLKKFESWLLYSGRKESTAKKHIQRLRVVTRTISFFSAENIYEFYAYLRSHNLSTATLNSYTDTIRLFLKFTGRDEIIKYLVYHAKHPATKLILTNDEIEKFLAVECPECKDKDVYDLYTLFFELAVYTGARPNELAHVRIHDFNLSVGALVLNVTKTGVQRIVPIPDFLHEKIKRYYDVEDYLFVTKRGKLFSHKCYYHQFKQRLKLAGLNSKISLYSFRHSFITNLLNEDVNIHKVAKIAGHSINQTATYEHLTTSDIRKAAMRHPLIRKKTSPEGLVSELEYILSDYLQNTRLLYSIRKDSKKLYLEVEL